LVTTYERLSTQIGSNQPSFRIQHSQRSIWVEKNNKLAFRVHAALVTLDEMFSHYNDEIEKANRVHFIVIFLSFFVTGKDCQPRMCITIGALTIGGTM